MAAPTVSPGKTLVLEARTYDLGSSELQLPDGASVVGTPGKTILTGSTPDGPLVRQLGEGCTLNGVTLAGGGFYRDGGRKGTTLLNVDFRAMPRGRNQVNAIGVIGGAGLTVRGCSFSGHASPFWISNVAQVSIEWNELWQVGYGIKAFGNGPNTAWRVAGNYIHDSGPDFMASELQGFCDGVVVEDNFVEKILYGPAATDNDHSLLMSLPIALGRNITVRRNTVLGRRYTGGVGPPMSFECGGDNALYEENYVRGGNVAFAVTDKDGTASVLLRNNRVLDCNAVWNQDKPSTQKVTLAGDNGPNAPLSWNVNRGRPRRDGSFDASVVDASIPTPSPAPSPQPTPAPLISTVNLKLTLADGKPQSVAIV